MRKPLPHILFSFCLAALALHATLAATVEISPNIPGSEPGGNPVGWVANFYQFALAASGVLAFGAIVYGGFKYTLAAGNPSGQSEAKQWIWGALQGIILLAAAYLILRTINPKLTELRLPTLRSIGPSGSPQAPSPPPTTNTNTGGAILEDVGTN